MKAKLLEYSAQIKLIQIEAENLVIGKEVTITSNYNGQAYGHSKPSLKGTKFIIKSIYINSGCEVWLWDGNFEHVYIELSQVEFV